MAQKFHVNIQNKITLAGSSAGSLCVNVQHRDVPNTMQTTLPRAQCDVYVVARLSHSATRDRDVIKADVPALLVMNHYRKFDKIGQINGIVNNLCVGSSGRAGSCRRFMGKVDVYNVIAEVTAAWTSGGQNWCQTWADHIRAVDYDDGAFKWQDESASEVLVLGFTGS